ncbi:prepilin peptidase, partial [Pantoea endophytica]
MLYESLIWLMYALLLLSVGSFINVVIYRLPLRIQDPDVNISLALPRSHCPDCKSKLRIRDNIPVFSWMLLRGRCFNCRNLISFRYPLIELITLLTGILLALLIPFSPALFCTLILFWMLLALTAIDLEHKLLPDALTLALLWAGLLFQSSGILPSTLKDAVWGAAGGFFVFWLVAEAYLCFRGCEALGMGDAKLLAALGAWLGWQQLPAV